LKFYIAGIGNSRICAKKTVENIRISSLHPKKDVAVTETRLLSHKTRKSVKRCNLYRCTSRVSKPGAVLPNPGFRV